MLEKKKPSLLILLVIIFLTVDLGLFGFYWWTQKKMSLVSKSSKKELNLSSNAGNKTKETLKDISIVDTDDAKSTTTLLINGYITKGLFAEGGFYKFEVKSINLGDKKITIFLTNTYQKSFTLDTLKKDKSRQSSSVPIEELKNKLSSGKLVEVECQIMKKDAFEKICKFKNCSDYYYWLDIFNKNLDDFLNKKVDSFKEMGFVSSIVLKNE